MSDKWVRAQNYELEYWRNTPWHPTLEWEHHDPVFMEYLSESFDKVADIGCGPVPYFNNKLVKAEYRVAVDPLFRNYIDLARFEATYETWVPFTGSLRSDEFDAVFAINYLDHAANPVEELDEIKRIIKPNGLFFFFVDIEKELDDGHLFSFEMGELKFLLHSRFQVLKEVEDLSWKPRPPFNKVLWFVGRK